MLICTHQGRLSAEVELQAKRMRDRQIEVAELAKRQPSIGMHFAGLPTEAEVVEFGNKARTRQRLPCLLALA
jgi:hypothetical protein